MSTGFQVVWEKFCQLWQIEMRTVPLTLDHPTLDIGEALKACDENTICIVPIAGVTWTGLDDDIEGLDKALDAYNAKTGYEIPIHVDAASGGFILPFLHPEKKWDFRLKWVLSISTSGHKYGLVYPGLGWVVWKDKKYLPDEMSFSVNYLGANITQVGLNFSRPAAQILGQYYNFIRLGFEGYKEVQQNSMDIAKYCHEQIGKMPCFRNYAKEVVNPLFIWMMDPGIRQEGQMDAVRPAGRLAAERLDGPGIHHAQEHRRDDRHAHRGSPGHVARHGRHASGRHPQRRGRVRETRYPHALAHQVREQGSTRKARSTRIDAAGGHRTSDCRNAGGKSGLRTAISAIASKRGFPRRPLKGAFRGRQRLTEHSGTLPATRAPPGGRTPDGSRFTPKRSRLFSFAAGGFSDLRRRPTQARRCRHGPEKRPRSDTTQRTKHRAQRTCRDRKKYVSFVRFIPQRL